MTDRELLELAAKAAGIDSLQWESDGTIQNRMNRPTIPYECQGINTAIDWNPLTDDGDALRLAVKLELDLYNSCISVRAIHRDRSTGASVKCRGNNPQMDLYAATRRAIVCAAAEIGKSME